MVLICISPEFVFRRRQWHPTPVLLPGESHGQRSLVGCRPWGCEESETTERLHFHFSVPCIGEENGNPLQCSSLENPRDGAAWWAAVYGVAQSQTRLKRLSSIINPTRQMRWYVAKPRFDPELLTPGPIFFHCTSCQLIQSSFRAFCS